MDQLSQLLDDSNTKLAIGLTVVGVVGAVAYQISSGGKSKVVASGTTQKKSSSKKKNEEAAERKRAAEKQRIEKEKAKIEEVKRRGQVQQEKEQAAHAKKMADAEAQKAKEAEAAKKNKKGKAAPAPAPAKGGKGKKDAKKAAKAPAAETTADPAIEEGWEEVGAIKKMKVVASQAAKDKAAAAASEADADGSVKLSLGGASIGSIVGKKGANIQRITTETGAKLDMLKEENIVKISGSTDAVQAATLAIQLIIEQEEHKAANTESTALQLDAEKVKAVIGKKGSNIQNIQALSGARLDASIDDGTLTITGDADQVASAKILVNNAIYGEAHETIDLVKKYNVHLVMGAAGATIRKLQDETGAKFELPRDSTQLTIRGAKDAVATAVQRVREMMIENQGIAMQVGSKIGSVVGKGGANIKEIQEKTGVQCDIERDSLNEATLQILGPPSQVEAARKMVEKILSGEIELKEGEVKDTLELGQAVSAIIGKGGDKVRELQATHGVKIDITRGTGTCNIIGAEAKVKEARAAIDEIALPILEKQAKSIALLESQQGSGEWGASVEWGAANGTSDFDATLIPVEGEGW